MANYALIDKNNIVVEVITGKNENEDVYDWEQFYYFESRLICKRTSYNTKNGVYYNPITNLPDEDQSKAFRKNYAGIGYKYDVNLDAFIPPKPYPSWILNEETCNWQAPVTYPNDGNLYNWDETTQSWVLDNTNN